MISLDQVLLLQKKVETAVERIRALNSEVEQLKADNDALRNECEELKNALSAKSGLVSTMEADQNRIEESILNALNQLDTVENALLTEMAAPVSSTPAEQPQAEFQMQASPAEQQAEPAAEQQQVETVIQEQNNESAPEQEQNNQPINGQFDIF